MATKPFTDGSAPEGLTRRTGRDHDAQPPPSKPGAGGDDGVLHPSADDDSPPSFIFRYFLCSDARLDKLFTPEDPLHIHKTLGLLAVLSFVYRYAVVYPAQGNLGFDGSALDWLTMAVHLLLPVSSLLFYVPAKRIATRPMVIYEEYRQHAVVFTLRTFSTFALAVLAPHAPFYAAPLLTAAHHLVVDRITAMHGNGSTAVRANSERLKPGTFYQRVAILYSFYQFLALGAMLVPSTRAADMAYNAIIAIQSSAFLMTLFKKRIVRGRTHMVVYGYCLVLSAFHFVRVIGLAQTALIAATFALRVKLPSVSKYVLWLAFVLVSFAWRKRQAEVTAALGEQASLVSRVLSQMLFKT